MKEIVKKDEASTLKRHRTENSNKKLMTSQLENASAQAHKYTYT